MKKLEYKVIVGYGVNAGDLENFLNIRLGKLQDNCVVKDIKFTSMEGYLYALVFYYEDEVEDNDG